MNWICDQCNATNLDEEIRCSCGYERQTTVPERKKPSLKKRLFWVGEIASIFGALYCIMGTTMIASFSVAAPERGSVWVSTASLYSAGLKVFSVLAIAFAIAIFMARKQRGKAAS